ncbi:hypothetical protein U8527_04765 [Kordia algicida OT-1]|uniref:Uncharacterized protein n=1 Tax=Kordia algicida OT-1 TaxID=391587 RepID=A9DM64_9FLAO|nr:hypothetical protein [Kordia algicida]EDP97637.1 hypothetical protein KAOT1_20782 [Kordia algicida OT-1]
MKKNIKSLSLSKRKISALNQSQVNGGLAASATPTIIITLSALICPADDNKVPAKPHATSGCP